MSHNLDFNFPSPHFLTNTIRNYWCHQCYLDFIYIENDYEREKTFQTIAQKLHYDEYRTYDLFKKTEEMRLIIMRKYR